MSVQHLSFKNFTSDDKQNTTTLLHENIPIAGTLMSGTYATSSANGRELNIKSYSHGMFQSVYDYPHLSSSANHIFDISAGFSTNASSLSSSATTQVSKKVNIYNQMAQVLAGYDTDSTVRRFDFDGDFSDNAEKVDDAIFINFSRLLIKDEIKKGSFEIVLGTEAAYATPMNTTLTLTDSTANGNFRSNSPAGEYGFLKASATTWGLIYYQAGVVVLNPELFGSSAQIMNNATSSYIDVLSSSSIDNFADGIRHRVQSIAFNNTTELNSSVYSCKIGHNDFNYSSNPTYLENSKIVVKTDAGVNEKKLPPVSYVTTVGLYSANNELMAVAKLSEPLRNDPTVTANLRVRLDF